MPMAAPTMPDSESGVSITRASPNSLCSSAVQRNTPPFTPTSSPRITTSSSSRMASRRLLFTACTMVISVIASPSGLRVGRRSSGSEREGRVRVGLVAGAFLADQVVVLVAQVRRHLGVHVGEERVERRRRRLLGARDGRVDLLLETLLELLL